MIDIGIVSKYEEDRRTISSLLTEQEGFHVVSTGIDGFDAIRTAMTKRPDIIIMDFSMEGGDSPDLAPVIRRNSPLTALIVLFSQEEQGAVDKSLKAGISGCLLRSGGFVNLVSSVKSVYYGGLYVSETVRNYAMNYFSVPAAGGTVKKEAFPEDVHISGNLFSPTEICIFHGIVLGHTDKEIARNLNISTGSLRNCVSRVKHKTGLHNRTQITVYALLSGIINIGKFKDTFL